jgi:hypothetical protein
MEIKVNEVHELHLFAFYVTEGNDYFYFVSYFWENLDAFYVGEASYELLNKNIKGYKIQEHLISTNLPFSEIFELESPINNHIVLNDFC